MSTHSKTSGFRPGGGNGRKCTLRAQGAWLISMLLSLAAIPSAAQAAIGIALQTSNPTPVAGGSAFSYTITLTNLDVAGPSQRIFVTDALPNGVQFLDLSISGTNAGGFSCSGPAIGSNGTVSCTSAGIPGSGSAVVVIVAQYTADMSALLRTNTARVVSGSVANSASVQQSVINDSTQSIAQVTGNSGPFVIRRTSIVNAGASAVVGAMYADAIPPGTSFVSVNATGALARDCSFDPGTRTTLCAADFLPAGTTRITLITEVAGRLFADGFE
jgi:uncharacterized repeat protein (TIGR01451 family)